VLPSVKATKSRDHLGAEIHKRGDRGDESDDGSCLSHADDENAYLNVESENENDISFGVHDI